MTTTPRSGVARRAPDPRSYRLVARRVAGFRFPERNRAQQCEAAGGAFDIGTACQGVGDPVVGRHVRNDVLVTQHVYDVGEALPRVRAVVGKLRHAADHSRVELLGAVEVVAR